MMLIGKVLRALGHCKEIGEAWCRAGGGPLSGVRRQDPTGTGERIRRGSRSRPNGLPFVVLVTVMAVASSCASPGDTREAPSSPQRLAGCWSLQVGEWSAPERQEPIDPDPLPPGVELARPDTTPEDRDPEAGLPIGIRLDSLHLTGWPALARRGEEPAYRAVSLTQAGTRDHPFGYWRPLPPDSLVVGHPAAYAGTILRLRVAAPDTLRGSARAFTDVAEGGRSGDRTASVELRRTGCLDPAGE